MILGELEDIDGLGGFGATPFRTLSLISRAADSFNFDDGDVSSFGISVASMP